MSSNSAHIVQDIRAEFESLLGFVAGEEARTATADQLGQMHIPIILVTHQESWNYVTALTNGVSSGMLYLLPFRGLMRLKRGYPRTGCELLTPGRHLGVGLAVFVPWRSLRTSGRIAGLQWSCLPAAPSVLSGPGVGIIGSGRR